MTRWPACRRGHVYAPGSWKWKADGTRRCLICYRASKRAWQRDWRAARRAVADMQRAAA